MREDGDDLRDERRPEDDLERRLLTRRDVVKGGAVAAAAIGVGLLLAACGGDEEAAAPAPAEPTPAEPTPAEPTPEPAPAGGGDIDQLTWAVTGDPVSMAFYYAYDFNTNPVVTNITEALLRIDPQGQLQPNLAESWEQVDPLTYVYQIRSGVKFHDGSDLTAEDVAFSLSRHREEDLGAGPSYLGTFHERVSDVTATGPLEVTVKLSKPDALWQYAPALTAGAVSSKAFLEANGKDAGTPEVGIIGTGPYKFVSWTKGQEVVLERFDDYWNKDRPSKVKTFVCKIIPEEATIVSALGTGEIDGTFGLSGKNVQALAGFDTVQIVEAPSYQVHYLLCNTTKPPFDDPRVRQALSYAIDKAGILESTYGGAGEGGIKSPAPPALWTYSQEIFQEAYDALPSFDLDLEKAKALIEEAGATGTKATILVGQELDELQALAVQDAGTQIGLDLSLEKIPIGDKIAQEFSGPDKKFSLSVTAWGSDIPDPAGNLFVNFWSGNAVTDNSSYKNAKVDELFEQQRESTDPDERARLLTEAQAQIVADQPWIIFYNPTTIMPLNKRVGGYELRPLWYWDPYVADFSGAE